MGFKLFGFAITFSFCFLLFSNLGLTLTSVGLYFLYLVYGGYSIARVSIDEEIK